MNVFVCHGLGWLDSLQIEMIKKCVVERKERVTGRISAFKETKRSWFEGKCRDLVERLDHVVANFKKGLSVGSAVDRRRPAEGSENELEKLFGTKSCLAERSDRPTGVFSASLNDRQ